MTDIFLKFVNTSISAGWLVLAVIVFRLIFPKMPKWLRPVFWGLVGLRLVLFVSIESVLSLIPSAQTIAPEIMYTPEPAIHSGLLVINTVVNPVLTNAFAPGTGDSANPLQILIPVMAAVWLAGILVMLALAGISCLRLRRRVRTAVLLRENIYQSENVSSPFVFGFLRPRIYLPFGVDDRTLSNVILHEQAHIARHDHQGKILGYLLLGLYWFNPLCWAAYLLFCRDIELACDEQVIRGLDREERADYSEALLALSAPRLGVHICPLAFGEIGVKERVRNVLNYKKPAFWAAAAAIAVCIVMAVCFLTNPKQGTGMDDSRKGGDSVRCWFDEYENPQKDFWSGSWEITVAEFPGVTFRASWGKVEAVTESGVTELFGGMPIWNVYFADLGGDGLPELCATVSYGSGIIDEHIIVYDYAKQEEYTLWERGVYDYVLRPENEKLTVRRSEYMNLEEFVKGNLQLTAGENGVLRLEMARDILKGKYYTMKTDEESRLLAGYVSLFEDGSFTVVFSPLSSYIAVGTYEAADGRLTLRDENGWPTLQGEKKAAVYVFDIVGDTLVFDADASSRVSWWKDGEVFE